MSDAIDSRVRTAITMTVLVVLLLAAAIWGWTRLTAPVPAPELGTASSGVCTPRDYEAGATLTAADVVVNVYNASGRSGLAQQTMTALTGRGFTAGNTGNAPEGAEVARVEIRTNNISSTAVGILRANLGDPVVVTLDEDVDAVTLYVGPGWDDLKGEEGSRTVPVAETICGPNDVPLP
ncbi:LytR C-terminal domain-containing protein [Nocardioides zeae]|uniref:LytR C-terminal domain-containing protein n=1 Tax=Nocardioides zeae TaxID=1457234 RepID=A0A6P0HMF5_9ACTN|nr:LytR C-terminal domain-containing protein [Nocardioides zeae]